jgi:outer membrane protein TolC
MEEEALEALAMKHRADLLRLKELEKVARDRVRFTKGDFFPSISAEGVYFTRGQDPESSFFIEESWSVSLLLNYPIFQGGLHWANLQESRSQLRVAELARRQMEKQVGADVHNALLNLRAFQDILESVRKQVAFSSENFEMVSRQFQNGLVTNVDVLDANSLFIQAERDLVHAAIEQEVAYMALQRSVGQFVDTMKLDGMGEGEDRSAP